MGVLTEPRIAAAAGALPLADEPSLWAASRAGDAAARTRLIEAYLPYARMLAAKLFAARIDYDIGFGDYVQYGTVGLIESVDRFDPGYGILFKTYCAHRIQGAIRNGLEQLSEKRVQVSTRQRLLAERRESAGAALDGGMRDLFQQLADVAVGLAIGYVLDDVAEVRLEDIGDAERQYGAVEMRQLRNRMHALVASLPQRERLVIKYHYLNQVPFNLIAETMGITKGRVSQIHRNALALLRSAVQSVRACDAAW